MSTPVKIGVYIVSVLVILAVALTVLIKTQITPEKVRETLLPLAEKTLQRNVDFGDISVGLFSGISVADLKVLQRDAEEEFFSVKSLELHYQFWPLLTGKVIVDQILLDQPKINIIRMPKGHFNFSDLLPEPTIGGKDTLVSDRKDKSTVLSAAFNLLVKEVNIKAGELLYVDKFKNAQSPFRYNLNKLNLKVRQITFDKPFPVDFSAVVNGSNIDISGKYDFSHQAGDLTIHLAPLDVVQFAPYYRDIFPGKLGSAQLSLNLEVDIQPDLIASKGEIVFDDVDLVLKKFPDTGLKKARLGAEYALSYNINKQLLNISTLLLNFNEINLGAEGEFDLSAAKPFLVFSLFFDQFDLRDVMRNLPIELSRGYQKYSFAGVVDGQIDFSGKLSSGMNLLKSAQLSLTDVRASSENLRAGISGDITYVNKVLRSENLFLQYGDQQVRLQMQAEKLKDNLFHGDFVLTADVLDLNKILNDPGRVDKAASEDNNTPSDVTGQKTPVGEIGPFDIPVDMVGTLKINRVIYKKLHTDKVSADLSLKNNHLSIQNLSSNIGGGEMKFSSTINLGIRGLAYQGQMALSQPDVATLIAGLLPETNQSVSGLLQWQNSFYGRGTIPDNLLRVLQLKGEFSLRDGEAKGSPLFAGLASFLGNSDLKILSFQSVTGQYDLHDGLTSLSGYLDSSKTKLTPSGTIDLAGRLNLRLKARFAPEIMDKLGLSESFIQTVSDRDGWGNLPLKIKGTLNHPEVGYDTTELKNQVLEKAKEKASQKLLEKVAPGVGDEVEPLKQLLDNTLNKLFGQ